MAFYCPRPTTMGFQAIALAKAHGAVCDISDAGSRPRVYDTMTLDSEA